MHFFLTVSEFQGFQQMQRSKKPLLWLCHQLFFWQDTNMVRAALGVCVALSVLVGGMRAQFCASGSLSFPAGADPWFSTRTKFSWRDPSLEQLSSRWPQLLLPSLSFVLPMELLFDPSNTFPAHWRHTGI